MTLLLPKRKSGGGTLKPPLTSSVLRSPGSKIAVSVKPLSKCPSCNATTNFRWPACLGCGEVLPSMKALAHRVLERNGSRVTVAPANDSPDHWDDEMTELTHWFVTSTRPLIRFEISPGVRVLDPEQYWAGLKTIVASPPQSRVSTSVLQAELRRLHKLFGPAA